MMQTNNLQFFYQKGRLVLDGISLEFNPGTIYGLFGGNGEGKSTFMKLLAGLLFPKSGSYHLFGKDSTQRQVGYLQEIFIVPEDFDLTGLKIRTYEKVNSGFYPKFSKDLFYELIGQFKLSPEQNIATLSFGQKKKVLVAFGIATNTKLLLLDEPTNGLDIPSKSQFRKIMASAVDQGKCIVISTHQVRDLHSLIDHIIILDHAKVVLNQPLANVAEKLWFGKASQVENASILYAEDTFGGKAILPREQKEETEVDLELLFNAVLNDAQSINKALKKTQHEAAI